jgi:hypothetical protein
VTARLTRRTRGVPAFFAGRNAGNRTRMSPEGTLIRCAPNHVGGYLLHHRHDPDDCGVAFASFKGHRSPLRHGATIASCLSGGHGIWWLVDASSAGDALKLVPFFVAERSTAVEVTEITIP